MDWKKVLKWVAFVAVVCTLIYCVCSINGLKKENVSLEDQLKTQTETVEEQTQAVANLVGTLKDVSELCGEQKDLNELFLSELAQLRKDMAKFMKDEVSPEDLTAAQDRIDSILSQIEQLEKDKITEADFDKWVQDVEKLVNSSLVELSKPPTVPPVKPMPNITPQPQKVALSNQEKAEIVRKIKKEVFKQFEQAGYGKFEGDRFVLKKGFFGARIYPGELESHKPVSSYVDDFRYGKSN
jgi:hypothetical protein